MDILLKEPLKASAELMTQLTESQRHTEQKQDKFEDSEEKQVLDESAERL